MTTNSNIDDNLLADSLNKYFGYHEFRSFQKEVIENTILGNDSLVILPTGKGKSLCFQLAALILEGMGVVVSPLIALMKDQVDNLVSKGIAAVALNSSIGVKKYNRVKENCLKGEIKILYISPETLIKEKNEFLKKLNINLFAIDEAHSISQWGHDFRPDYMRLCTLHEDFPHVPIMALTATATRKTKEDIVEKLRLTNVHLFSDSVDRPNIYFSVYKNKDSKFRIDRISELYKKYKWQTGIVYCNTRRIAQSVANKLNYRGCHATVYHAGLTPKERRQVQESFTQGTAGIVCATIAFGMGIDKPDIRWIVHYNTPKSIEQLYQEVGRAGRDGKASESILFYNNDDLKLLLHFAELSGQEIINRQKISKITEYAELKSCRRAFLLDYFDTDHEMQCSNCDNCKS